MIEMVFIVTLLVALFALLVLFVTRWIKVGLSETVSILPDILDTPADSHPSRPTVYLEDSNVPSGLYSRFKYIPGINLPVVKDPYRAKYLTRDPDEYNYIQTDPRPFPVSITIENTDPAPVVNSIIEGPTWGGGDSGGAGASASWSDPSPGCDSSSSSSGDTSPSADSGSCDAGSSSSGGDF